MGLWTPAEISTYTWLDFSDASTLYDATSGGSAVGNGVGIARAEDKSGNARHFTQATSASRPTWTSGVQNGLGVARHDGNDWLTSVSANSVFTFLHSGPSSIFLVVKSGATGNPNAFYSWIGNNAGTSQNRGVYYGYDNRGVLPGLQNSFNALCANAGGQVAYASSNAGGTNVVTDFRDILAANVYQVNAILSDPTHATASSRIKLGVNGFGLVGNNERTGPTSANSPTYPLQIGAIGNGAGPLTGDFCELIILGSLASTDTRQTIEGYLAHKWGLAANLPSDHPYKVVAPTTSGGIALASHPLNSLAHPLSMGT